MFPIHDDTPRMHGRPYINYSLIGINIIIFIYEVIVTSNFSNRVSVYTMFSNYGATPDMILSGQNLGSIFSSMFMHGSIAHLLGNMFFLYVFGDNIEDRFGHYKYLLIYLFWGVMATFAHSIFAVSTGDGGIPAVGASGAISGVLGAYLIFFPRAKIHTIIFAFFITTVRIPALAYIPFWFIMQLVFALIGQGGGVAYLAHIGGFLVGVATAYAWRYISPMFFNQQMYRRQQYRRPSPTTTKSMLRENNVVEKVIPPEVLVGDGFVDVIFEERNVTTDSEVIVDFEQISSTLLVEVNGDGKKYSIPIPNPNSIEYYVSSTSVVNGIIKIRLEPKQNT